MEVDFPAAHSMDTYWFAVDRDGHVACFDTGEAGAVPTSSLSGDGVYEVIRQLGAMLPSGEMRFERDSRVIPAGRASEGRHRYTDRGGFTVLMFLDSLDPVREEIAAGRARGVTANRGEAVIFATLAEDLTRRLHEAGQCKGCYWHIEPSAEWSLPLLAAGGIYEYSHLCENWISGPYGLERSPVTPIHIDQLPPRFRDAMKRLTLAPFCFADTPYIQPVEHADCHSWQCAYLDVTGSKIYPIPGREADYAHVYDAHYARYRDEMEVEPPRESPPGEE